MPLRTRWNRTALWIGLAVVSLAAIVLRYVSPPSPSERPPGAPLAGFSYSPKEARYLGLDPVSALQTLLLRVHPDLVRMPVYWDSAAPTADHMDFGETDRLLDVIAQYDQMSPNRRTQVVLVVGARNLGAPELYLPSWVGDTAHDLIEKLRSPAYSEYLSETFQRYAASPLLYGWQVENEPLDSTNPELGNITVPTQVVAHEVQLAHRLDPAHPVVITTFNSATAELDRQADGRLSGLFALASPWKPAGHPRPALQLGDVLGLNEYVATPNSPLARISVDQRLAWKSDSVRYWADQARSQRKQVWITEMQASPWKGVGGFTPRDLQRSAELYRDSGVSAVFLWGAEQWIGSQTWLDAALQAVATLDGPGR